MQQSHPLLADTLSTNGTIAAALVGLGVAAVAVVVFHPQMPQVLDWAFPYRLEVRASKAEAAKGEVDSPDSSATGAKDGWVAGTKRFIQRVFETVLSRVLLAVFTICFVARFVSEAELHRRSIGAWNAIQSGVWSGAFGVLTVLVGVVLWRLAHSERLR